MLFFTVTLQDRSSTLLVEYITELRVAFRQAKARMPFQVDAIVVLPEHIHAIFTLPAGDDNYSSRCSFHQYFRTGILPTDWIPKT